MTAPDSDEPIRRVAAAFDRIVEVDDPAIFISTVDRDTALASVDPTLPLAGLTFVAKNNIDIAGLATTAGCPSYAFEPSESAPAVQRLVDAGATCLGATNLDQFATGLVGTRSPYGVPLNAIDPLLVPGGSSSGSAVAVALGIADFGLGTDTAGSGRVPAAQNRIVGFKGTRGLVPTRGVVPAVRSLDCVSLFARNVELAARGLEAIAGFDQLDPWSRLAGPPIAVPPRFVVGVPASVETATDADATAWAASVERLEALPFVDVETVDLQPFIEVGQMLYNGPWVAERFAAVGEFLATDPADADPTVASIISNANGRTAVEAYEAQYRLAEIRRRTEPVWQRVDALMTPTTPGVATLAEVANDPVGRNSALGTYTNFVNLLDLAGIAVPGVDRDDGWPFGVTFLGPAWSEELLVDLAGRFVGESQAEAPPSPGSGGVDVVVVGAHLEGQPLNWQLTDHGGRFVRAARTTPNYLLYALEGGAIAKPALVRTAAGEPGTSAIEVEVWRLPAGEVGRFTQYIPEPLGLGRVQLEDGSAPTGFIAESIASEAATDVTHHGGWRTYLAQRDKLT